MIIVLKGKPNDKKSRGANVFLDLSLTQVNMARVETAWRLEQSGLPSLPRRANQRMREACAPRGKSKGGGSMKLLALSLLFYFFLSSILLTGGTTTTVHSWASVREPLQGPDKFIYADFETTNDNRPVSNRGGLVQMFSYQENAANPSRFKGVGGSNVPEVVRLSKDDPNKAITFDYELRMPNQWAGVTVEVHGQPDKDGKPVADDMRGYKYRTLQLYVTGVTSVTVEFLSKGQGIKIDSGGPQMSFRVSKGFNTYKVALDSLTQPPYVETRVKPRDLIKKLTQVNISVACNQCVPASGTVVIDNLIFQN